MENIFVWCVAITQENPYLGMNKRESFRHNLKHSQPNNSMQNKLKVVLGITLSGILIIALASIASMVLYRKKFWKKEECVVIRRRWVEKDTKPGKFYKYRIKYLY